jgi:bifunctional non-homologous end joining protein LigD
MAKKKDTLAEYRRKRDFEVTPEPAPKKSAKAEGPPRFMVHKHDATRLHYDLRLEMDGALASWAIPKGPSYDPESKRLAVQTEDHPLEYGNFEGRIPEGEYGAGDSIIWDRGVYDTLPPGQASAQRKKGHLHFVLDGEKLKGGWHLVRTRPIGGKAQWLCFKAKDGTENAGFDVTTERPESVATGRRVTRGPVRRKALDAPHPAADALLKKVWPPMKATLSSVEHAPAGGFFYEVKYDGYRAVAAISNGRVAFQSRNALDFTSRFPQLARALARLHVAEAVIDGEVVALDAKGRSRFQRMGDAASEHRFVAFDLLWLDGEDLRGRPIEERRDLLESVLANVPHPLELAERIEGDPEDALLKAERRGLEGLIAKAHGSTYEGKRSTAWLKLKVALAQEFAVLGYTPIKTGAKEIGALLVGVHGEDGFHFAGKVGTGFDTKLRRELFKRLEADRRETSAAIDAPRMRDARWVEPRLVGEVRFTEWTEDGKLRHPAFQGLREDKRPEEAVRESAEETGQRRAPMRKAARHARQRPSEPEGEPKIDVALTHPERVIYPRDGFTKRDVFHYYEQIAPYLVTAAEGRPLSIQQWPAGIAKPGHFRQSAEHAPDWATTVEIAHERRTIPHWVVDRPETLLWLANYNALTLHVWNSRLPHLEEPDWVVFDLDPGKRPWEDVVTVAQALRGFLDQLGIFSVPKTSGKSGLHVLVPMARGHTHDDAVDFAIAITEALAGGLSDLATTERTISKRHGRLYLDAFQNGRGKTIVAPYSLRAVDGAPASTPLRWDEVSKKLDPRSFNLKSLPKRLDEVGDLFAPALSSKQRLPRLRPR